MFVVCYSFNVFASLETQGQIVWARESVNGRPKKSAKTESVGPQSLRGSIFCNIYMFSFDSIITKRHQDLLKKKKLQTVYTDT